MNRKKIDLLALASIPLVMTLGNSMLIPVLPMLEEALSITQLQSSLVITIYSIAAIVLIPIAGYLSDKFGRKKNHTQFNYHCNWWRDCSFCSLENRGIIFVDYDRSLVDCYFYCRWLKHVCFIWLLISFF